MTNTIERLIARVAVTETGCWEWTGRLNKNGYGLVSFQGRIRRPHRLLYEELVWPVGDGLELDHLCRNRKCCNPIHLQEVTHQENMRRGVGNGNAAKTHCPRGHEYSYLNTQVDSGGHRTAAAAVGSAPS